MIFFIGIFLAQQRAVLFHFSSWLQISAARRIYFMSLFGVMRGVSFISRDMDVLISAERRLSQSGRIYHESKKKMLIKNCE